MIVAVNRIFVKKEYQNDFEERFRGRKRLIEKQPGFIKIEILKPIGGEDYLIMSYWERREDFEAWVNSEDFKRAHSGEVPAEWFKKRNEFSMYEILG